MANDSNAESLIVAVSGGVDSVVLLDKLHRAGRTRLIVAHVDHGIRDDSSLDAQFVAELAARLGLQFELTTLALGADASEDVARQARYKFLRSIAKKHQARIVTAHHADDVIETIAINLTRGTGWRGLAVLGAADIERPLTNLFKSEIIEYAHTHNLAWREDSTNLTSKYLRNRIRAKCAALTVDEKLQILALWAAQADIAKQIDAEIPTLLSNERHFYIMNSESTGVEVLRRFLLDYAIRLTSPQLRRALYCVKAAQPGTRFPLGVGKYLYFSMTTFHLEADK